MMRAMATIGAMLLVVTPQPLCAQVRIGPQGPVRLERSRPGGKPGAISERGGFRCRVGRSARPELPLAIRLAPDPIFAEPGNAVPYYYQSILLLQRRLPKDTRALSQLELWRRMRPEELPRHEVRRFLRAFAEPMAILQRGARHGSAEWSIPPATGWDSDAHPEYNWMLRLLLLTDLRVRLAIAEQDFSEAEQWMQVGWKLARDFGDAPVSSHQGMAHLIENQMMDAARHWISAPDAPNLYWALANLPLPVADAKTALRRNLRAPVLAITERKPELNTHRSDESWKQLYDQVLAVSDNRAAVPRLEDYGFQILVRGYAGAKRDLRRWGFTPERLDRLPPRAVMLIHQFHVYRHNHQAIVKWLEFPPELSTSHIEETLKRLREEGWTASPASKTNREWFSPLWATERTVRTYLYAIRQERYLRAKRNALMVVEAVRDHMASHGGRLPRALAEITGLPLPDNPLSGRPFEYRWESPRLAVLRIAVTQEDEWELMVGDWQELAIETR